MFISGENYFNEKSLKEICEALEQGETVEVGIDCIGHTRNNMEQEAYKEALTEKYGSRLQVECSEGAHSYSYSYRLKYFAAGGKEAKE